MAGNLQPHGLQLESLGQAVEQQRRSDAIETAVVEGLAQIAGLQVVAAAEDRLVQEREHGLGLLAGRAADLAGPAQGFDERVEPLAVTAQLVVAIDPAGDQSGLQQRELAETAVVDLIEQPLLQLGKPRREDLLACRGDGRSAASRATRWQSWAEGSLLRRAGLAGEQGRSPPATPRSEDLELLFRSHRSVYGEVAEIADCGVFSAGGTSNNHNNSTLRNDNTPWGNSTGKRF